MEHHGRRDETQPQPALTQESHMDPVVWIGSELREGVVVGSVGHVAGQRQRMERLEGAANGLARDNTVTKDGGEDSGGNRVPSRKTASANCPQAR